MISHHQAGLAAEKLHRFYLIQSDRNRLNVRSADRDKVMREIFYFPKKCQENVIKLQFLLKTKIEQS